MKNSVPKRAGALTAANSNPSGLPTRFQITPLHWIVVRVFRDGPRIERNLARAATAIAEPFELAQDVERVVFAINRSAPLALYPSGSAAAITSLRQMVQGAAFANAGACLPTRRSRSMAVSSRSAASAR